jgi:hypothetical protein
MKALESVIPSTLTIQRRCRSVLAAAIGFCGSTIRRQSALFNYPTASREVEAIDEIHWPLLTALVEPARRGQLARS